MSNPTPAQEEFAAFVDKNSRSEHNGIHPEDRAEASRERERDEHRSESEDEDEEDRYRAAQIDAAMRMPTMDARGGELRLPPASFDMGRSTGVKGVIADARSYETARRSKWRERVRAARRSVFGLDAGWQGGGRGAGSDPDSSSDGGLSGTEDPDEAAFLEQWRQSRRRELEEESRNPVRNRRTSPSVRLFGRFDHVDALGYLDAIEKVGRETVVVVFVYDHEVSLSVFLPAFLSTGSCVYVRYGADIWLETVRGLSSHRVCPLAPRQYLPGCALRQGAL
jgi:hypothetical protein